MLPVADWVDTAHARGTPCMRRAFASSSASSSGSTRGPAGSPGWPSTIGPPSSLALVTCGSSGICPSSGTAAPTARDNRSDTARPPPDSKTSIRVPLRPFGDRVAAARAAAQSAVVHRDAGRRGASMTATAMAKRIAADTPALRANDTRVPLTGRQREIIALTLAAAGLTNRQIADRLDVGAHGRRPPVSCVPEDRLNSRDDLVTLIDQSVTQGGRG